MPDDLERRSGVPDDLKQAEREDKILRQMKRHYAESRDHLRKWRQEAKELYRFRAGHQWSDQDEAEMEDKDRPLVTFNHFDPYIDSVLGFEVNNRQEITYLPRDLGDVGVNELLSGAAKWVRDECQAEDEESDMFADMLVTGLGWSQTFVDYSENQDGKICKERRDNLRMFYDKNAKKKNLADRDWNIYIADWKFEKVESQWPQKSAEVRLGASIWDADLDDDEMGVLREHKRDEYKFADDDESIPKPDSIVRVAHYQWAEMRPVMTVQMPDGQIQRFNEKQWRQVKQELEDQFTQLGQDLEEFSIKQQEKVIRQAFAVGNVILEIGMSPIKGEFTYNPITGKRDRKNNTWYAMGRALKEPQKWYNKFYSTILEIIAKNSKGGVIVEEDAFVDTEREKKNWASPDQFSIAQSGALQKGKIMPKPGAEYPQGIDRLMTLAQSSFQDVVGVSLEALGLTGKNQPVGVEASRKQSTINTLAWAFDALRRYRKDQGSLLAKFIIKYIADGRLVRIAGERHEQFVPLLKDELTLEFDVIIDESPSAPNVKERTWDALEKILPVALQMQLPIPPSFVEYAPVPAALAKEWKQTILGPEPTPEQMEEEQKQKDRVERREQILDELLAAQSDKEKAEARESEVDSALKTEKAITESMNIPRVLNHPYIRN